MSPRTGALVRTVLLVALLGYSAFDDTMPPLWWVALALVLTWTLTDFARWSRDREEDPDD